MDLKAYNFIKAVLGEDGASALKKAVDRANCPTFSNAILPRTIIGWLEVSPTFSYEGEIPGVEGTFCAFKKSEKGFSGRISLFSGDFQFEEAPLVRVAAGIATALGVEAIEVAEAVKNVEIAKLGKSIDLLVKSKAIFDHKRKKIDKNQLETGMKEEEKEHGGPTGLSAGTIRQITTDHLEKDPKHYPAGKKQSSLEKIGGTEGPGGQAAPNAPKPPLGAAGVVPTTTQKKPPKAGILSTIKREIKVHLTKSQMEIKCTTCGLPQFKEDKFVGCLCFAGVASGVRLEKKEDGVTLQFSSLWDTEGITALWMSMKE